MERPVSVLFMVGVSTHTVRQHIKCQIHSDWVGEVDKGMNLDRRNTQSKNVSSQIWNGPKE